MAGWPAAACLAVLLGASATPAPDELTDAEKLRTIHSHIDSCAPLGMELDEISRRVRKVVRLSGGRDAAVDYIVQHGLGHREPQARMAAVEAVALIGNPPALRKLQVMVEFDPNYTVRRHAARAIAGFGDPVALGRLFLELPDPDGSLRKRLLSPPGETPETAAKRRERLADLGRTIARALDRFDSLIARLADSVDPDERSQARAELGRLVGPIPGERDEDWRAWWAARKGVPPPLHEDVNRTADRATAVALVELAALIDSRQAMTGIAGALRHGEMPVKLAAAAALGRLIPGAGEQEAAPAMAALREALNDPSGWVRAEAAKALAASAPRASAADFDRLLDDWAPGDGSPEHRAMLALVRRSAVAGLRAARAARSAGRVAELLGEGPVDLLLAWEAVAALLELGSAAELAHLARYAARAGERERRHALDAAAAIAGRSSRPSAVAAGSAEGRAARLWELAGGMQVPEALLAMLELNRLGELTSRAGEIRKLAGADALVLASVLIASRRWSPAVEEMAAVAEREVARPDVALAACRAVAEVGNDTAVKAHPGGELAERRRRAADALLRMLAREELAPRLAGRVSEALAAVVSRDEEALRTRAVAGLIRAVARPTLREARPEICAALRWLSRRNYADEPGPWVEWWKGAGGVKD